MGIEEFLLKRAEEKGIEKASYEKDFAFTKRLLAEPDFTIERIADIAGVSVSFVEKVKAGLLKQ